MRHWVQTVLEEIVWDNNEISDLSRQAIRRIEDIIRNSASHHFVRPDFEMIADQITETTSLDELVYELREMALHCGFQHCTLFVLTHGTGIPYHKRVITTLPEKWLRRYELHKYQLIDPVMRAGISSGSAIIHPTVLDSSETTAFWKDAQENRIGNLNLFFPVTALDGARLGVNFNSQNSLSQVKPKLDLYGCDMEIISHLAVEAFTTIVHNESNRAEQLTEEEVRFLFKITTSDNPNEVLKVQGAFGSNRTIQASIRRKLGVQSIVKAAVLALSRGLFNNITFSEDDIVYPMEGLKGWPTIDAVAPAPSEGSTTLELMVERLPKDTIIH